MIRKQGEGRALGEESRKSKLQSGHPEPHDPGDPRLAQRRPPAAEQHATRAFWPDSPSQPRLRPSRDLPDRSLTHRHLMRPTTTPLRVAPAPVPAPAPRTTAPSPAALARWTRAP